MAQLIDDLLRLSRVSRAELVVNEVDISSLARRTVEQLRTSEPNRQVEVHIEDGLYVQGDQQLLAVLLENLLGNAWKFTARKARPVIRLGSMIQDGERVLYVRDNGAGFDMTYVDKLFNAFQRLHTEGEFAGTGIGLATVRRIIRRHGGDVWAEGAINEGATFFFTLESINCQGGVYAPQGHTVSRG
ncbi:MAG: ATP-binding protein [Candidatus Zixiibacteriota bacterium]